MKPVFYTAFTCYDWESLSCGRTCLCVCVLSESCPSTRSKHACALNFGFNQWKPISDDLIGSDFQGFWTDRLHFPPSTAGRTDTVSLNPAKDEPNPGFAAALPACLVYVSDIQERYGANDLITSVFFNYRIYTTVLVSKDSVTYALAVFPMCFYIIYGAALCLSINIPIYPQYVATHPWPTV